MHPSSLLASLAMGSFKAFINQPKSLSLFLYSSTHKSAASCSALSSMSPCISRCINLGPLYSDVHRSITSFVVHKSACSAIEGCLSSVSFEL